jgi:hypothetical protein
VTEAGAGADADAPVGRICRLTRVPASVAGPGFALRRRGSPRAVCCGNGQPARRVESAPPGGEVASRRGASLQGAGPWSVGGAREEA